jgi:ubiquinone/menaquinone biosynthesis C-methylase UbiE
MVQRNQKMRPNMKWDVMDCRDLKYNDESFDLIIDKSTIDALLCGDKAYLNVAMMMNECQRVLKTGGYYVAISYGVPENREVHFKR